MLVHRSDKELNERSKFAGGFTMVEVLIVIALTIVLFFLLIRPLTDTLRYTKDAQLQAAAQDSARKTMEIMSREIGSAAYISDNASHPFNTVAGKDVPSANGVLVSNYSNFLDVQVPAVDTTGTPIPGGKVAHLYNAKIDLTMARHAQSTATNSTTLYDPTAGNEPIQFDTKPGTPNLVGEGGTRITATPLMLPVASNTSIIRYFIALKNPTVEYSDDRDHIFRPTHNNTYVLYRAQFNPYLLATPTTGTNPPQYLLFDTEPVTGKPFVDDPDFFRYVLASDVNWNDPAHATYGSGGATAHNSRVDLWQKIAKPIISAPEIDLLIMPHNSDRTLAYDAAGAFQGIAHYGADHDPVTGTEYPIEHSSITFLPGAISSDAAPATTADYQELGLAGGKNGDTSGIPYIPTIYQAIGQSWTRPYTVNLIPTQASGVTGGAVDYYYITQATTASTDMTPVDATHPVPIPVWSAGDVVEYHATSAAASPTTPVYNLTRGWLTDTTDQVIPASVNEDAGTINFSVPAVRGAGNLTQVKASNLDLTDRTWRYVPPSAAAPQKAAFPSANVLDLTQIDDDGKDPPLNNFQTPNNATGAIDGAKYLRYAFITPGSLRVYGPDMTPGANYSAGNGNPQPVLYQEVSANTEPKANQYVVDYYTSTVTFAPLDSLGLPAPTDPVTGNPLPYYWPSSVPFTAVYDYQSNIRPQDVTQKISSTNTGDPLGIKVTYHSREALNVNVGVRYIDSVGSSQTVVLSNTVKVGNLNR